MTEMEQLLQQLTTCDSAQESKSLQLKIKNLIGSNGSAHSSEDDDGPGSSQSSNPLQRQREFNVAFRKAIIQSNALQEKRREELFASSGNGNGLRNRKVMGDSKSSEKEVIKQTAMRVTAGLRNAVDMAAASVDQSSAQIETLDDISKLLVKTGGKYEEMQGSLEASKTTTQAMKNKDTKDRYILFLGITIFLLTVAYLIWRRLYIPSFLVPSL